MKQTASLLIIRRDRGQTQTYHINKKEKGLSETQSSFKIKVKVYKYFISASPEGSHEKPIFVIACRLFRK